MNFQENGLTIRDATVKDVVDMADRLRKEEVDEIWAEAHLTPIDALTISYRKSHYRFSLVYQDQVIAMFGVVPDSLMDNRGTVWMLTTNEIEKIKIRFLKISRKFVDFLKQRYVMLQNYVDFRHKKSIAWLKWLGANVREPEQYGIDKMPFCYFSFGGR